MEKILLIFIACIFSFSSFAQSKQVKFEKTVTDIMRCLSNDDLATINKKYIHPEYDLFVVYRMGVPDIFYTSQALEKDSVYSSPYFYTSSLMPKKRMLQQAAVTFNCDKEQWSKNGFFYQKEVPNLLSNIVDFNKKYEEIETKETTISKIKYIETNSYRVVETGTNIVFYLTWIKDNWYLTVFDLVTMDCSA